MSGETGRGSERRRKAQPSSRPADPRRASGRCLERHDSATLAVGRRRHRPIIGRAPREPIDLWRRSDSCSGGSRPSACWASPSSSRSRSRWACSWRARSTRTPRARRSCRRRSTAPAVTVSNARFGVYGSGTFDWAAADDAVAAQARATGVPTEDDRRAGPGHRSARGLDWPPCPCCSATAASSTSRSRARRRPTARSRSRAAPRTRLGLKVGDTLTIARTHGSGARPPDLGHLRHAEPERPLLVRVALPVPGGRQLRSVPAPRGPRRRCSRRSRISRWRPSSRGTSTWVSRASRTRRPRASPGSSWRWPTASRGPPGCSRSGWRPGSTPCCGSCDQRVENLRVPILLVVFQIGAVTLAVLAGVGALTLTRQTFELAVLHSRGFSRRTLLFAQSVQASISAAIAFPLGPRDRPAARAARRAIERTDPARRAVPRPTHAGSDPPGSRDGRGGRADPDPAVDPAGAAAPSSRSAGPPRARSGRCSRGSRSSSSCSRSGSSRSSQLRGGTKPDPGRGRSTRSCSRRRRCCSSGPRSSRCACCCSSCGGSTGGSAGSGGCPCTSRVAGSSARPGPGSRPRSCSCCRWACSWSRPRTARSCCTNHSDTAHTQVGGDWNVAVTPPEQPLAAIRQPPGAG